MRVPSAPSGRRAGVVTALSGVVLAGSATLAASAAAAGAPVVVKQAGTSGCHGVRATPGSENTSKTLVGGSMQPGGVAVFEIEYPVEAEHFGDTFTITDCVFVDGVAVEKYAISFVPNNAAYALSYAITIPADTPIGAEYCNYAKTTDGPSSPQASNRKANPACFNVGGSLRVEKHDTAGALLPGATFSVVCSPASAVPPVVVDGLSAAGVAGSGVIGINGPEGTPCVVTELAPPAGYALGAVSSRTVTIPRGDAAATEVFVNAPLDATESPAPSESPSESPSEPPSESPSEFPSEEPSEEPSGDPDEEPTQDPDEEPTDGGPTVEPGDPEPTVSPTVLGVKSTEAAGPVAVVPGATRPGAALPNTGSTTALLLALGVALTVAGAAMVAGAGQYQREH